MYLFIIVYGPRVSSNFLSHGRLVRSQRMLVELDAVAPTRHVIFSLIAHDVSMASSLIDG
jgi:hypothetical protein